MGLIRINTNPSRKQLAVFGATWLCFFGAMGAIVLRKGGSPVAAGVLWAVAAGVPAAGWCVPALLRGVYVGMAYAVWPVGAVLSVVLLAGVYYLVFTPIGLVMRLCGHDPMERTFPSGRDSHWQPRRQTDDVRRYFRQF